MTKSIFVQLTAEEVAHIQRLARERNEFKESHGIKAKRFDSTRTNYDIHVIGFGAELAVAKVYGVTEQLAKNVNRLGTDDGYDLIINGFKCEVKCRAKHHLDFILPNPNIEAFKADLGILVYLHENYLFEIYGVIGKKKLKRLGFVKEFEWGKRFICDKRHFVDPELLLNFRQQKTPAETLLTAGAHP